MASRGGIWAVLESPNFSFRLQGFGQVIDVFQKYRKRSPRIIFILSIQLLQLHFYFILFFFKFKNIKSAEEYTFQE